MKNPTTLVTLSVIGLFLLTFYLNGLYASIIFQCSVLFVFGYLYHKKKELILMIPPILSVLYIYILTIHFYLVSPWFYILILFPLSVFVILVLYIIEIVKNKEKNHEKIIYFIICVLYLVLMFMYKDTFTVASFLPVNEFMIYKEPGFMFIMIVHFFILELIYIYEFMSKKVKINEESS